MVSVKSKNRIAMLICVALILFTVILLFFCFNKQTLTINTMRVDDAYAPSVPLSTGIAAGGGLQFMSSSERKAYFDTMNDIGASMVRFDFAWADVQADGPSEYAWGKYDAVVNDAKKHNIQILGMIGYTPRWARPDICKDDDKCAPNNPNDYAKFVGKTVERYTTFGVSDWEIWNEPNNTVFWKPKPNAQKYTQLLQAAYIAAKKSNPSARIISGGLSPATNSDGNVAPSTFLQTMYAHKVKGSFDAVGFHPYCYSKDFNCPKEYAEWSAWSQMDDTPNSIRNLMEKNGDDAKKIWATEFGAPTGGRNGITEKLQATMLINSYRLFSAHEWAGPLFWYSLQDTDTGSDDSEDSFGILTENGRKKESYGAYKALPKL